jgi:hypothetical protein
MKLNQEKREAHNIIVHGFLEAQQHHTLYTLLDTMDTVTVTVMTLTNSTFGPFLLVVGVEDTYVEVSFSRGF